MNLPEKITTVRVKTELENAQTLLQCLVDALQHASTMNTISLYHAVISADALQIGKILMRIDQEYLTDYIQEILHEQER